MTETPQGVLTKSATMQLDLFNQPQEWPYQRKPKGKELAIILDVFGPEAVTGISLFLGDIIELYPFKSFVRNSVGQTFLSVGASAEQDGFFYCIDDNYSIYLLHNFSLFPDNKRHKQHETVTND